MNFDAFKQWRSKSREDDLIKKLALIKTFLYKFRIIILFDNANKKTANGLTVKYTKDKNTNDKS